jgi:hypothetical protein
MNQHIQEQGNFEGQDTGFMPFKMPERKAKKMARLMFEYLTGGKKDFLDESEVLEILKISYLGVRTESQLTIDDIRSYISVHGGQVAENRISYEEFESMVVRLLTLHEREQIEALHQKREEIGVYKEHLKQELANILGPHEVEKELTSGMSLFEKYDINKNGFLEDFEVPQLLIDTYAAMNVDYMPTQEDVYNYIKSMDVDEDGKISVTEYELFLLQALQTRGIRIDNINQVI